MAFEPVRSRRSAGTIVIAGAVLFALLMVVLPDYAMGNDAAASSELGRSRHGAGRQPLAAGPITEPADDRRQSLASAKRRRWRAGRAATDGRERAATAHEWYGSRTARLSRRVDAASERAAPSATPAPDGYLVSWRRHANGCVAAVVGHYDGTLTARPWPQQQPFVTGLRDLAEARAKAHDFAHASCRGTHCGTWRPA